MNRREFELLLGRNGQPKPVLAAQDTWYKGTKAKNTFTSIEIVDEYAPDGTETESWNADVNASGAVRCYAAGDRLILAGNGYGRIYANPDSFNLFSGNTAAERFGAVTQIVGAELIDTSEATTLEKAFNQCFALSSVDVSGWDVSRVTNMYCMFQLCIGLQALDLSRWDVSNVRNFGNFIMGHGSYGATVITTLGDISRWNVGKCTSFQSMFQRCWGLKKLDLSGWDTGGALSMASMFASSRYLEEITLGEKWTFNGAGTTRFLVLEATDGAAIPGADGKWYTADGTGYTYDQIPNYTAATYYAVKPAQEV